MTQKKPITVSTVLVKTSRNFADVTAISGVNNVEHSPLVPFKILWGFIFVFGMYFTVKDAKTVMDTYYSYPYNTQVDVQHAITLEFPSVTVCNQNRISCEKLLKVSLRYYQVSQVKFDQLFKLYILTHCGYEGLGCNRTRQIYYDYRSKGTPQRAYDEDQCLKCEGGGSADLQTGCQGPSSAVFKRDVSAVLIRKKRQLPVTVSGTVGSMDTTLGQVGTLGSTTSGLVSAVSTIANGVANTTIAPPAILSSTPTTGLLNAVSTVGLTDTVTVGLTTTDAAFLAAVTPTSSDGLVSAMVNVTGSVTNTTANTSGGLLNTTGTVTGNAAGSVVNTTGNVTGEAVSSVGNITGGTVSTAGNITGGALSSVGSITSGAITAVGNITGGAVSTLGNITSGAITTVGNITGGAVSTLGNITSGAITTVGNITGGAVSTLGNITSGAITTVGNITGGVVSTLGNITSGAITTVGNITGGAVSTLGNITSGAIATLGNVTGGVVNTVGDVVGGVVDTIGNIAGDILTDFASTIRYDGRAPSKSYNLQMEFFVQYLSLSEDDRRDIGYSMEEFIRDCDFMGLKCNMSEDFTQTYSSAYGNCFTFTSSRDTSLTGSIYGLTMVLDVRQDTYLPQLLTRAAGVRLAVHRIEARAQLEDSAIDLPVNSFANVAIRKLYFERLSDPFDAACKDSWNATDFRPPPEFSEIYTTAECVQMCLQHMFFNNCICRHPLYPEGFYYKDSYFIKYPICNLTMGSDDFACVNNSMVTFVQNPDDQECGCNVECQETQYELALTTATWPPTVSQVKVNADYNKTSNSSKDLLMAAIYFSSLNVDEMTQQAVYQTTADLVASLGGALGLYLGISLVLIVEVFEYVVMISWNLLMYSCGKYKPDDEDDEDGDDDLKGDSQKDFSKDVFVKRVQDINGMAPGARESWQFNNINQP